MVAQLPYDPHSGQPHGHAAAPGIKKEGTKLSKRIGWLNSHGGLTAQIKFSEVGEILDALGDTGAMKVLKDVEEKGAQIRDPTAYLKTAARRALEGGGSGSFTPGGGSPRQEPRIAAAADPELHQKLEQFMCWMNDTVPLRKPLDIQRVIGKLTELGGDTAIDILKRLHDSPDTVNDPTGWVVTSAGRALTNSAGMHFQRGPQPHGHAAGPTAGGGGGPRVPFRVPSTKPGRLHHSGHDAMDFSSPGGNAVLMDTSTTAGSTAEDWDMWGGSSDAWSNDWQESGPGSAVRGCFGGAAPSVGSGLGGAGPSNLATAEEKLKKRVAWLNNKAGLASQLMYDRIAPFLLGLESRDAMDILKKLEEHATTVKDPNGYVEAAARRRATGEDGRHSGSHSLPLPGPPAGVRPSTDFMRAAAPVDWAGASEKLRKRIGWLNSNANLAAQLRWDDVGHLLLSLAVPRALEILKHLEEHATTVRDPNGYVCVAVRKVLQQQPEGALTQPDVSMQSYAGSTHPQSGFDAETDQKIRKKIGWLNKNVQFNATLMYAKVSSELNRLGGQQAMAILKELEEYSSVPDPTAWVLERAQSASWLGSGELSEAGNFDEEADQKVRRKIGWLNTHVQLNAPLMYAQVSPELRRLSGHQAMAILKELEENASEPDPTAWVLGRARMSVSSSGSGEPAEERLRKRISWLNEKAQLTSPIVVEMVMPSLLAIDMRKAMRVLKGLEENAQSILDPSSYVTSAAQESESIAVGGSEAFEFAGLSPDEALHAGIDRLNSSNALMWPLEYDAVSPWLLSVDTQQVARIFRLLETEAMHVEDPNAFVNAEAQAYLARE